MMDILPIFKSHYSIGRSILTLEDEESSETYPDSIIDIAKENKMKEVYLVEDNMTSFLQAYTNTKKYNINLRYGLRLTVTDSITEKSDESRAKNSKIIIFFKNENGYRKLIKLFSIAAKDGFYYEPRIDYKTLKENWSDKDLMLCIPFYDSFIYNNLLRSSLCIPELDFTKPIFFVEDNEMPFDNLLKNKLTEYFNKISAQMLNVKSIFYKTKKDFKAYLTFRCINNRSCLNKPEIEHMTSDTFCFESWQEKTKNG